MAVYENVERLYAWIDEIPLSRCKKNLTRDFSDGVLMAELCKHLFPKLVDLHNYPSANSHTAKVVNWDTLNRKVFSKLHIRVTQELIQQIAACIPGALESVLMAVKEKVEAQQRKNGAVRSPDGYQQFRGEWGDNMVADSFSDIGILSEIKKLKSEVQLKNDTIAVLNQKVVHLESLIDMKDKRLKELMASVDRLQAQSKESQESFCTTTAGN
ncbi:sperm flagellar protein 1-like [Homalodisca vitripennis]|uniref:sperm flagellar protein 1-like n=1 Tax=Homalodisca vitripennis TaxID=197043 RepID=UPI001EECA3CE|nr:sperm flagellar protein 1-like [Homalodisca vitripennis]KAG8244282.1 Sperm flagellar protein 1 [Homalodisca vitripennis]